jgi:hypothetical protein
MTLTDKKFNDIDDLTHNMAIIMTAFDLKIKTIIETFNDEQKIIYRQKIAEYFDHRKHVYSQELNEEDFAALQKLLD